MNRKKARRSLGIIVALTGFLVTALAQPYDSKGFDLFPAWPQSQGMIGLLTLIIGILMAAVKQ